MTGKRRAAPEPEAQAIESASSGRGIADYPARDPGRRDEAGSTPLDFGPDGQIELKDAVPRQRDAVLRILREEAEHAAAEENRVAESKAQSDADKIAGAQIGQPERVQSIVRTGKSRIPDSGRVRKPVPASEGRLRSLLFALAAALAIAVFAYQFAVEIGNWIPWLKPYLAHYVDAADRLVAWLAEVFGTIFW